MKLSAILTILMTIFASTEVWAQRASESPFAAGQVVYSDTPTHGLRKITTETFTRLPFRKLDIISQEHETKQEYLDLINLDSLHPQLSEAFRKNRIVDLHVKDLDLVLSETQVFEATGHLLVPFYISVRFMEEKWKFNPKQNLTWTQGTMSIKAQLVYNPSGSGAIEAVEALEYGLTPFFTTEPEFDMSLEPVGHALGIIDQYDGAFAQAMVAVVVGRYFDQEINGVGPTDQLTKQLITHGILQPEVKLAEEPETIQSLD